MDAAAAVPQRPTIALSARRTQPTGRFYGHFVGLLKVVLPTVATALLLMVLIWPRLYEQEGRFSVGQLAKIDRTAAENLQMTNARYTGVDNSKRPFAVTAEAAEQANADSPEIELLRPKADIVMADGSWIALTAELGNYNRSSQVLELAGTVNLFHDRGLEFRTNNAVLDLKAGDAIGTEPVHGQGPFGHVQAEGFVVHNRGERIEFSGKSRIILLRNPTDTLKRTKTR